MATVKYEWYWREENTATITVDFSRRKVVVENHSDEIRKLPFGDILDVTFSMFEQRISRMVPPKGRPDIDQILASMGLDKYDPYRIIEKTHGRMSGNFFSIVPVERFLN